MQSTQEEMQLISSDVLSLLVLWDFMPLLSSPISFLHPTLHTLVPILLSLIACVVIFRSFQSTFLILDCHCVSE
jgi:hypothetical protein